MNTSFIRNIGIAAHVDAGKTTATERILFYSGETHKMGSVDAGTTVTDHLPQEKTRGITITSAAVSLAWATHQGARAGQRHALNLIDTPGHIDFTAEVERSLRVLDGVVVLFSAVDGVQPQSETVWRQADKYRVPRVIFVNKMDRPGADFARTVAQIRERLGANSHPLYLPVGREEAFAGVIDVVGGAFTRFEVSTYDPLGLRPHWEAIPAAHAEEAARARAALIEALAEVDGPIADLYLENRPIGADELRAAIRRATISRAFFGIVPGSAFREKGVQRLLDAVVDYLPSPLDLTPQAIADDGTPQSLRFDAAAPLVALAFKLTITPNGQLFFVRVYQGTLRPGQAVYNPRTRRHERITRLVRLRAAAQENIPHAPAGDICAVLGLRDVVTGDTLSADLDVFLQRPTFPEPVVSLAIEPQTREDQERLGLALQRLVAEDPTLRSHTDPETGQTLLSGMGELHLEVVRDRMATEFRVATHAGRPQIAYRETITRSIRAEGEFKHQNGGRGQYGRVAVVLEPAPGQGNVVLDEIVGGAIPRQFIRATLQGIDDALKDGVLHRSPVTDVRVRVVDGEFHATDSSDIAFRTAARLAFKNAMREAGPVLLEPIMAVEVTLPTGSQGDILGDLGRRRGEIRDVATEGTTTTLRAEVPLEKLFGYAGDIRSLTKGRANYTMTPARYAQAPASAVAAVLETAPG